MTVERYLWWLIVAWAFSYAWRAFQAAQIADVPDASGTNLLRHGANAIAKKRAIVGSAGLLHPGRVVITHIVSARIDGRTYRITMEEADA